MMQQLRSDQWQPLAESGCADRSVTLNLLLGSAEHKEWEFGNAFPELGDEFGYLQ
jgi:hypothetical protein